MPAQWVCKIIELDILENFGIVMDTDKDWDSSHGTNFPILIIKLAS